MTAARLGRGWAPEVGRFQDGLFTVDQALAAGATPAQVRRARDSGRWATVAGAALALAGTRPTPWRLARAASMTWPDGVVCLAAAAALHGLPVEVMEVDVIVPGRRRRRRGLVPHRLRLEPDEVQRRGPVQVTSLQRTLFDCLGGLPTEPAQSLLAWAVTRDLLDADLLAEALDRRPSWQGNRARREALVDARRGTLGAAERLLRRLLVEAGIEGWRLNEPVLVAGVTVARADALFPAERLVIEVDGVRFHDGDAFQRDRTRQNSLVTAGYTVLRFTWADLTRRPHDVLAQIRLMLERLAARR